VRLTRPRAALIDWDNTLVDSFAIIHEALNQVFAAMEMPPWSYEETCRRIARSMRDAFPRLFGPRWPEARDLFYAAYAADHLARIRPLPGAEPLLAALRDRGAWLGVVSNKTGEYLRREVRHLGWQGYFASIVGAADAVADKPDPAVIDHALAGSGIAAGPAVWFIGDNAIDVACAEAGGCLPIIVGGAVASGDAAELAGVRWRFRDRLALIEAMRELDGNSTA